MKTGVKPSEIGTQTHCDLRNILLNLGDMGNTGFYTKLNVWGSLGLNFDYDGGPIIENGGPIF